jgi:hypothetical protein
VREVASTASSLLDHLAALFPQFWAVFLGSVQLRLQVASLPGSQNLLDPPLYKLSSLVPIHAAAQ